MCCKLSVITSKLKCFASLLMQNKILSHFELFFKRSKFVSSVRFITPRILFACPFISAFFVSFGPLQFINIVSVVWLNEVLTNNDVIFGRYFLYFYKDSIIWLLAILISIGVSLWCCSKSCSLLINISSTMCDICLFSLFCCLCFQIIC